MKIDNFCHSTRQVCNVGRHEWNVARLFTLVKDFKVMTIPLDHLYIDYTYSEIRLRDMVGHMKSVNDADLSYPIILDEDGVIMDGRHRVMKALLAGNKTIKAVRFDENPTPDKILED